MQTTGYSKQVCLEGDLMNMFMLEPIGKSKSYAIPLFSPSYMITLKKNEKRKLKKCEKLSKQISQQREISQQPPRKLLNYSIWLQRLWQFKIKGTMLFFKPFPWYM